MAARARIRLPDRFTWAMACMTTLGFASWAGGGWVFDALSSARGLGPEGAGRLLTVELLAMGITLVVVAPFIPTLPRRPWFLAAFAALLAAQIGSAAFHAELALTACRALSGVAFGYVYALAAAMGAEAKEPERAYAAAATIQLFISTILHPALGNGKAVALAEIGPDAAGVGVFGALTLYAFLVGAPLLVLRLRGDGRMAEGAAAIAEQAAPINFGHAALVILAMGLFATASNGFGVLMVQVGERTGLDPATLGNTLALTSLIGASGGFLAHRLGLRFGASLPTAAGVGLTGVVTMLAMTSQTPAQYWVAVALWVTLTWFAYPYVFGLAAAVDAKGRIASLTGSMFVFSGAIGAYVAGRLGTEAFGTFALVAGAASAIVAVIVVRLLPKGALDRKPPAPDRL